jgi:YegS/Rv2252/BmrU family lipid kinase
METPKPNESTPIAPAPQGPIVVIFNPAARGEKAGKLAERVKGLSDRIELLITSAPGEARQFAVQAVAKQPRAVVAAGGDGTVNEVANGIAGSNIPLGLLPIGTMNVFATELGIPLNDLERAWQVIESGTARPVDLLRANHHRFVQLAGVGFDAQIVQETPWEFRKNFGPLSYLISATQIAARKPPKLLVTAPGHDPVEGSFVLIGNGRFYGGPFVLFKDAEIDDGLLDILVFQNLGYVDIVRYLQAILFGTHLDLPDVRYFQTAAADVTSEKPVPVEVDGEVIGQLPIHLDVLPDELLVLAPPPSGRIR